MDNQKLVRFLNQLLANYFVIYVKLHRYHWYVQGEHFFHLHDQFEEMYRMFANDLDELAERILRSEEHTSELQSRGHLVCRLLLEKTTATASACARRSRLV